jgi:hypothetical protein
MALFKKKQKINPQTKGMQIHEIQPVILGGSPTDPANKTILTRQKHAEIVTWWNRKIKEFENQLGGNDGEDRK